MMFRPPVISRRRKHLSIYDSSLQKTETEPSKNKVLKFLSEFCGKSSIHGLAYLGDPKRSLIERICWTIAIASSLSLCGYGALKSWQNYEIDRITLRYSKNPVTIDTIPFPAVSICPVTKTVAKKFNYTDVYRSLMKLDGENSRNVTPKEFETMKIMNHLCEFDEYRNVSKLFSELYAPESMYETMMEIAPKMNETLIFCKLFNKWINCKEIFFLSLSDTGFCYSFNVVRLSERVTDEVAFNVSQIKTQNRASTWNIDDGYKKNVKIQESYPFRVVDAGLQYSLTVILKTNNVDIDYLCGGTTQGFKIAFHSSVDTPRGRKNFFKLSPNRAAIYAIEPKYTKTETKVRKFSPQKRQCYFNSERKLRFYRIYTRFNCLSECLSNYTLAHCGCVHFTMMHSNGTKICGMAKMECLGGSERNFYNSEDVNKCNCLSSCSELTYDAYPSATDFDFVRTLSQVAHYKDTDLENISFSRLIVSFKSEMLVPLIRIESYNWADTLSYIGGICGLFIGASLVSIIEMIYYFTIRAYFGYRNHQNPNGSQPVFPYLP